MTNCNCLTTFIFCTLGLALSGYAYYVELQQEQDKDYKPWCDIDNTISCSKPFKSKYGKGMGLVESILGKEHILNQPNPVYGLFVYPLLMLLTLCNIRFLARLQFYIALVLNMTSVYLGYILYFVLEALCVICISIYVINFVLLIFSYLKLRKLNAKEEEQKILREDKKYQSQFSLPTTSRPMDFKKNI